MLTRKGLLDLLKSNGFKAEPTLENVKSFINTLSSDGVEIQSDDGTAINVDAIWGAKSVLKLAATEDTSDTTAEDAQFKAWKAAQVKATKGSNSPHAGDEDANAGRGGINRFSIGNTARKAYASKIKSGRAVFDDADTAEVFGAWSRATILGFKGIEYAAKKSDLEIISKAQVEYVQQTGGALVPVEFMPNLIWLTEQYGVARKVANVVPMARDVKEAPRKTGIVSMSPITEAGSITASDNSYGNVTLVAKKYGALFKVSREILNDAAINISDDIANSVAEAQAIAEDDAYLLGDGSATYSGQLGIYASLPSGAKVTPAAWSAHTLATFTAAMGTVANVNTSRLAFICSRQYYYQVMLKLDKQATQYKDLSTGMPGADVTFLGYPVFFSQRMSITSTAATTPAGVAFYFGDFAGGSMLGDRKQVEIATSDQFYFDTDSLAVRGISRFNTVIHGDGRASSNGPISCVNGA